MLHSLSFLFTKTGCAAVCNTPGSVRLLWFLFLLVQIPAAVLLPGSCLR